MAAEGAEISPNGIGLVNTSTSLGIASVGFGAYKPNAKYLWAVEINCPAVTLGGLGNNSVGAADRVFSLMAYKAVRPKFEFEEITVTHLNEWATFAGKIKICIAPPDG